MKLWASCPCHLLVLVVIFAAVTKAASAKTMTQTETTTLLPKASDLLVDGLEEFAPAYESFPGEMYAGRLPMDNGKDRRGYIMFWLFAPHKPVVEDSITIWLNGGPGCSSFNAGVLFENSPVTMPLKPAGYCCSSKDDPLGYNIHAWTNATTMLYVEQPVGVGFSTGGPEPVDENEVSADFYAFFTNFLRVFTKYQTHRLFIVGESYAGYFVPSIAHYMNQKNKKQLLKLGGTEKEDYDSSIMIRLEGIGLGNGWMDARVQGPVTIDYAYWHGMIDSRTKDALWAEWEHCMNRRGDGSDPPEPEPFHAFDIPDDCAMQTGVLLAAGAGAWDVRPSGPNTYDVTTWDPYPVIDSGNNNTEETFLNNPAVKRALHAPEDITWRGCMPGGGRRRRRLHDRNGRQQRRRHLKNAMLDQDRPVSTVPYVAELLDDGIRTLVYNGDRDLSTCVQGSEMLLNAMEWSGASEWPNAPRSLWTVGNEVAGYVKTLKGLEFVVVYNSGHMVPYNQPAHGLDLITRFVANRSFADVPLPRFHFDYASSSAPTTTAAAGDDKGSTTSSQQLGSNNGVHRSIPIVLLVVVALVAFGAGFGIASRRRGGRDKRDYQPIRNSADARS